MTILEPPAASIAPFALTGPAAGAAARPLVFATPHSGRFYPAEMLDASALDAAAIRRSEDAFVDDLIAEGPRHGASVIAAGYARAYIDLNRDAWELDPSMFEDELPAFARGRTARVAAGLGAIARIVAEGQEIYRRKLTFAEAETRVARAHAPYHAALDGLIEDIRGRHGLCLLIDWHSMPSAAAKAGQMGRSRCDMVLGDRYGAACGPAVTRLVETRLEAMGYAVARNAPYAGGYTTEHYGRPARGVHALQIEINRDLYLDEDRLIPHAGFARLKADLEALFGALAGADWKSLL